MMTEGISYPESLLEPTIIGNVLALRHLSVHVEPNFVDFVPRILINHALRAIAERIYSRIVPPLLQVAILVVLSP